MSRLLARLPGALLVVVGALGAAVPVLHPAHDAGCIVDGAVMPALARGAHAGGATGTSPHALAALIEAGPLGTLTGIGVPVMIVGCLALGAALWRGAAVTRVPRWAAMLLACCWMLVPLRFVLPAVAGLDVMLPYVALGVVGAALLRDGAQARTRAVAPRVATEIAAA